MLEGLSSPDPSLIFKGPSLSKSLYGLRLKNLWIGFKSIQFQTRIKADVWGKALQVVMCCDKEQHFKGQSQTEAVFTVFEHPAWWCIVLHRNNNKCIASQYSVRNTVCWWIYVSFTKFLLKENWSKFVNGSRTWKSWLASQRLRFRQKCWRTRWRLC